MTTRISKSSYWAVAMIVVAIALVAMMLMRAAEPTLGDRIGNAVDEVGDGIEDAGRELDPNRTTGEKIGDAVEDVGEEIQDAADQ